MKLKHRKLVLIISMSAMGIGLISFSIAGNKNKNNAVESIEMSESSIMESATPTPTEEVTTTPTATNEPTQEPTTTPTDTPTPTQVVQEFEEDVYPEINDLIVDFLQAKIDGKTKKMKKLVTDPSYIDAELIQKRTEFIESYDNIKVYTAKVPDNLDADFVAYVYEEVKIASIDTKAPGLDQYLIKKVDGEYKIVYGDISTETSDFVNEVKETEAFTALMKKVNKKMKNAVESDEQLADFVSKLEATTTPEE